MKLSPYEVGTLLTLLVNVIQCWIVGKIIIHEWRTWRASK
jgi:hypothetical protein